MVGCVCLSWYLCSCPQICILEAKRWTIDLASPPPPGTAVLSLARTAGTGRAFAWRAALPHFRGCGIGVGWGVREGCENNGAILGNFHLACSAWDVTLEREDSFKPKGNPCFFPPTCCLTKLCFFFRRILLMGKLPVARVYWAVPARGSKPIGVDSIHSHSGFGFVLAQWGTCPEANMNVSCAPLLEVVLSCCAVLVNAPSPQPMFGLV